MGEQGRPVDRIIEALRRNPLDFAGDLEVLREQFEQLGQQGAPADGSRRFAREQGGIPVLDIVGSENARAGAVIFAHAGGYVAGSAASSFGLAHLLSARSGRRVVSVDYRLAPEHPFPAARDDLLAVYRALMVEMAPEEIAFVGASAGGGIVMQALMALRDAGEPLPAAAALFSPFVDLTLSGSSYAMNAQRDPSLTHEGLRAAAIAYAAPDPAALAPSDASLRGLPPLQIHVGSLEILLSDSLSIAQAGAEADVHVELHVWPGMVHAFPTFSAHLAEGDAALQSAGDFVNRWIDA